MPNSLKIKNGSVNYLAGGVFYLQWTDSSGTQQSCTLGAIGFSQTQNFQIKGLFYNGNVPVPDGANCWVACNDHQSESNFTVDFSDKLTASYNLGESGFSLVIEPNQ